MVNIFGVAILKGSILCRIIKPRFTILIEIDSLVHGVIFYECYKL
jgi:hypothetical protein